MPEFKLEETGNDDPLFPADDPLKFALPDPEEEGGWLWFTATDDPRLPDDEQGSLVTAPRTYLINSIAGQATLEDEDEVRKVMTACLDANLIATKQVMKCLTFLNEQREAARKKKLSRKTRRPTGGPSGSI